MDKMRVVVDTNIFFASLFNLWSNNASLFLHSEDYELELISPYFLFEEVQKHIRKQAIKKWYIPEKLMEYVSILLDKIRIYDSSTYQNIFHQIKEKMQDIDPKDTDFVALAFHLKIPLWSNDKKLKENVDFIKVWNTEDVLNMIK